MLNARIISSLDKVFPDSDIESFAPFTHSYIYKNRPLALQIALRETEGDGRRWIPVSVEGIPAECVGFRTVEYIYSDMPARGGQADGGYCRTEPGLYPDLLQPMHMNGCAPLFGTKNTCVWVEIDYSALPGNRRPRTLKKIPVKFILRDGEIVKELDFELTFIPTDLPEQEIKVTQWFHCDCLADYYNTEVWSERHWEIVENFVKTAVRNGINTLLTPVFTPPLDTHVGGERRTTQLVGVKKCKNSRYIFNFDLLDRWIDMCDRCGVKYFEISHLFTQWGAAHAPKIMADTPEGYRRIFGWETDATGDEYKRFLHRFLENFLAHMKARGDDKRCLFHVSDEPNEAHLRQYMKSRRIVARLLKDYTVMDALSNVKFYKSGAVTTPIPSNDHIGPFIKQFEKEGRSGLWTYYCCGQTLGVSNHFFATKGARTRFIGTQFWKYNIAGFLQWGYNFYSNCGSYDAVNPYIDTSGSGWVPSGDAFTVYPASDGTALESVRIRQFYEALGDLAALRLLESLIGREETLRAVEENAGCVVFAKCIDDTPDMLALREKIDTLIAANFAKPAKK